MSDVGGPSHQRRTSALQQTAQIDESTATLLVGPEPRDVEGVFTSVIDVLSLAAKCSVESSAQYPGHVLRGSITRHLV